MKKFYLPIITALLIIMAVFAGIYFLDILPNQEKQKLEFEKEKWQSQQDQKSQEASMKEKGLQGCLSRIDDELQAEKEKAKEYIDTLGCLKLDNHTTNYVYCMEAAMKDWDKLKEDAPQKREKCYLLYK